MNKILEAGWHFVEGFLGDNNMENDSYGDESFGAEFSVDHVLNSDQEKKKSSYIYNCKLLQALQSLLSQN